MKALPALALTLALALVATACGSGESAPSQGTEPSGASPVPTVVYDHKDDPISIVVSLPIFADLAREMGGDQVEVTVLIPPGEDPHTYVPPPEDAKHIQTADLVLVNGLGLDQPTIDFIEANRPDGRLFMVDFVRNIPSPSTPQPIGGMPIFAKEVGDNPHLWLDPVLVPIYAETISHSLVILDEINEAYYDALFANYKAELAALEDEIGSQMAQVPEANRALVTEHDSMIHWANRYGLTVLTTMDQGEQAVRDALAARPVPAVFAEAGLGEEALGDIATDLEMQVCEISTDTVDSIDASYIETMRDNSSTILDCLGG